MHRSLMLIDLSVGLLDNDKMLIEMLVEMSKQYMLVLTKTDKVKAKNVEKNTDDILDFIKRAGSFCVPVINRVSSNSLMSNSNAPYGIHELKSNMLFHMKQDLINLSASYNPDNLL